MRPPGAGPGLKRVSLIEASSQQAQQSIEQQKDVLSKLGAIRQQDCETSGIKDSLNIDHDAIGNAILGALQARIDESQPEGGIENTRADAETLQNALLSDILHDESSRNLTNDVSALALSRYRLQQLQKIFLSRLDYRGMQDRAERIAKAHEATFQWIFADNSDQTDRWTIFRHWLESDSTLYWITGKPGSGKSTLMKYISQAADADGKRSEPYCVRYLKRWAGDRRLVVASFFFWSSGIPVQMSQQGLLLTLCYQILSQVPQLIPAVSPKRWESLCLFNKDLGVFTAQELLGLLRECAREISKNMRLCLFVDGLDEFEGRPTQLVDLLQSLVEEFKIKICVSSRPWVIFEDSFRQKPSLMLQNLTRADIRNYIIARMLANAGYKQLQIREHAYSEGLIDSIVSKASGVFLWINLVVSSLLAGMEYGDRISDLQKRLDLLPPDLEDLYDKILRSLDPFYLEHAAQFFQLVEASWRPLSLLHLSFADEEDSDFALQLEIKPMQQAELLLRADTMRRRLNSRCKGFLEVGYCDHDGNSGFDTVQYLHRSVKDYIQSPAARTTLDSAVNKAFDPQLCLLKASLAHLKIVDTYRVESVESGIRCLRAWYVETESIFAYARSVLPQNTNESIVLLDDLDKTMMSLFQDPILGLPVDGALKNPFPPKMTKRDWYNIPRLIEGEMKQISFLALAVQHGLVQYVNAKVPKGGVVPDRHGRHQSLLVTAVASFDDVLEIPMPCQPCADAKVRVLACLLHKGADPNYAVIGSGAGNVSTIWGLTIRSMLENHDGSQLKPSWCEVAELMIKYGASVKENTLFDRTGTPRWLLLGEDGSLNPLWAKTENLHTELLVIKKRVRPQSASSRFFKPWKRG